MNEFLAMGGHGYFVWGSYGVTAVALALELVSLRARRRAAMTQASTTGDAR